MKTLDELHNEYFTDLKLYRYDAEDDNRYQEAHTALYRELMTDTRLEFKGEVTDVCRSVTRGDVDEAWEKLETYLEGDEQ